MTPCRPRALTFDDTALIASHDRVPSQVIIDGIKLPVQVDDRLPLLHGSFKGFKPWFNQWPHWDAPAPRATVYRAPHDALPTALLHASQKRALASLQQRHGGLCYAHTDASAPTDCTVGQPH